MKNSLQLFILALSISQIISSQSTTPKRNGEGMSRMGFIHRYDNWVYPDAVLLEWQKSRGGIEPASTSGLLTNPYRSDGTSLSYGIELPSSFTGKIPVFTQGNWWPTIGKSQTAPLTYSDLNTDTGATYNTGKVISNSTITTKGIDKIKIVNKTPYSYLVSSGVFPGNEQPGQVMTIIDPNDTGQLPIPPKDWWEFNFRGNLISAVPEVYSSIAGLNPLDAPGWKHSSWSPKYTGGIQAKDFGTGGFAYTFGSLFGRNDGTFDLTKVLFAGFHTNEGYDPLVSGDPGYGCAFYIDDAIQAIMDINLTGTHTAQAILIAQKKHNPAPVNSAFDSGISHLASVIGVQPDKVAELHYISHEEAKRLINTYSSNSNWKKIEKKYQSNTQAKVQHIALPKIIPSNEPLPISCSDGIKNGLETGIDCGGICSNCSTDTTVITGKFVPDKLGTLLAIGQDATSIEAFSSSTKTIPAALSAYTSINNVEGIDTEASYGTGPQHLSRLTTNYPNSALVVAVYLVDQLNKFNAGTLNTKMDLLIDKLVALDKPIYLRWGYEFDGTHNHYEPKQFITAWKKMYNRIKLKKADKNIAMVWHSGAFCGETYKNYPIASWYPGKNYVDLIGISVFTPQDCNYKAQNTIVDFARSQSKPVIIAEATPQGYDVSDNSIAALQGPNRGVKSFKLAQQIWDEWYKPFFNYIESNKDVIRLVTYINADWNTQGFWDAPYDMGYWGDSRIQANKLIESNWNNQTKTSKWIKGDKNLFKLIGYIKNGDSTSTCTDNIKNGDETNIDCGGTSCKPCAITPTCTDNIKNGDETNIDCGGTSCKPCKEIAKNEIGACSEFGISYIDPNTARVFHKDLNFKSNIYACINNYCFPPTLINGYYYYDFNSSTTHNLVSLNLNQKYTIKFQADFTNVAEKVVTFTTQYCSLESENKAKKLDKLILFPNPSSDFIRLIGENITDQTQYNIYTINGKMVLKGEGKLINISAFSKGLYVLIINENRHELFVKN